MTQTRATSDTAAPDFLILSPPQSVGEHLGRDHVSATLHVYVAKNYMLGSPPESVDKHGNLCNRPTGITIGTAPNPRFVAATEYTVPIRSVWARLADGEADYLLHIHAANPVESQGERDRLNRDLGEIVYRWLAQ